MKHIAEGVKQAQEEAMKAKAARGHAFDHIWVHEEVSSLYRALDLACQSIAHLSECLINSDLDITAHRIEVLQMVSQAMQEISTVLAEGGESAGEGLLLIVDSSAEEPNDAG